MKNKIEDLRNHLFAQLERLGDESLSEEDLKKEQNRSKAIAELAKVMVESAKAEVNFLKVTGGDGTGFIPEINREKQKQIGS